MSKKFITVDGNRVQLIHYMPFDAKDGLGKTEAELEQEGFLLDEIPDPVQQEDKIAEPHYTPEFGFYYEYIDKPQQNMTLTESVQAGIITPEQFKQITGMDYVN